MVITLGTGSTAGNVMTMTSSVAYQALPSCVVTPGDGSTALGVNMDASASSTTVAAFGFALPGVDGTAYTFNYRCN